MVRNSDEIWSLSHNWWYTDHPLGLLPIVKIVMSPPAMNTCSQKITHHTNKTAGHTVILDSEHFFTLSNILDNDSYVHLIQWDTCLYNIQDLDPEDIAERLRIKKKGAIKRWMKQMRHHAEIQAEKVKRWKKELQIAHKRSQTEDGKLGMIWWNREYWDMGRGEKCLKVKKEEPITPLLWDQKITPSTPSHWDTPSHTSTSCFWSIDPNDFVWSPIYRPSPI